jgi:GNAT superfamily N-acetyltransferase
MHQITINPLRSDDIDELISVARRIWHAHYPGIISVQQIDYMLERGYNRAVILDEMARQGIAWLAITDDSTMIGFVSVGPHGADTIKLHKLYLLPEYHGKGIGAQALEKVEQIALASDVHTVVLNVNKLNAKAIRSYERAGWHISAQVINDIGNGYVMDDFIMTKQIGSSL